MGVAEPGQSPRSEAPPVGLAFRRRGASARIDFGGGRRLRTWAFRAAWTLSFLLVGYRADPAAGAAAGVAAAALLWAVPALRRFPREAGRRSICWNAERVWVELPAVSNPPWAAPTRVAEGPPSSAARAEPLPRDSMPRAAVEQVRLDELALDGGAASLPRLLIEAEHGRLELVGRPGERAALEWARDRLREELLG